MIRYPSFIIVFLIVFVAISLYQVKHFITQKELELAAINKKIINTQSDLNILKAELSYLKRPNRIEKIARNKLDLKEISAIDIWNLQHLVEVTKSMAESEVKWKLEIFYIKIFLLKTIQNYVKSNYQFVVHY